MAVTVGTLTVPDASGTPRKLKTLNDSADSSFNPAHPLLDPAGAIISPATAENQVAAIEKLDAMLAGIAPGSVNLSVTPAVTAGAYTTGMVAGGKLSLAGATRLAGGSGIIQSVSVAKKAALSAPYDVFFFHTDPSNGAFPDNSPLNLSVADLPALIGVAHCTDLIDAGTPKILQAANLALPFKLPAGTTTLYAVPVIRGSETYASTSALVLNVGILRQ